MRNNNIEGNLFKTNHGEIMVVKYNSAMDVIVKFIETGYECTTTARYIRTGCVKDKLKKIVFGVGFIGSGPYQSRVNGDLDPAYIKWHNMLMRCYSNDYLTAFPTYKSCSVCDEWHNYQNFAKWFYENIGNKDKNKTHLDKDILQSGSSDKVYSPSTCLLVNAEQNNIESFGKLYEVHYEGKVHTVRCLSLFCREHNLNISSVKNVLNLRSKNHKGVTKVVRIG